jgi:hypothetical protein
MKSADELYEVTCLSKKCFRKREAIRTYGKEHCYLCPFCLQWHGTTLEVRPYQLEDSHVLYKSKKRERALFEFERWSEAGASLWVVLKNKYYYVRIE